MKKPIHTHEYVEDVEVLSSDRIYSLSELCTICRIDESTVIEYIDYGVIVSESTSVYHFSQPQLERLLRGTRLQRDLELNHAGVALALDLLETIDRLKRDMDKLKR